MKTVINRCIHCNIQYTWQASGIPDDRYKKASRDYCNECTIAINEALKSIPKKREFVYEITNEVTVDQLRKWEVRRDEESKQCCGFGKLKRVFSSLYNEELGGKITKEVEGMDEFYGKTYIYSYWSNKPEDIIIKVEREKNLETGELIN